MHIICLYIYIYKYKNIYIYIYTYYYILLKSEGLKKSGGSSHRMTVFGLPKRRTKGGNASP